MRRRTWILLAVPSVFHGLFFALILGEAILPYPVILTGAVLALLAPVIAVPLLSRLGAATGVVVVTAVVSVVRWAVFLASVNDPYGYYAWPVDVVLSIGLLLIALRVRRGALERGATRG